MKKVLIVGIFIFMTKWNFMFSWVEHDKSFITSGLDWFVPYHLRMKEKLNFFQNQSTDRTGGAIVYESKLGKKMILNGDLRLFHLALNFL